MPPEPDKENALKTNLDHLDNHLDAGGVQYLCGDQMTIADISVLASLTELEALDYSIKCYGELNRWMDRMKVSH